MKNLIKIALSSTLATAMLSFTPVTNIAYAVGASGDYQRTITCRQLRRSGELEWYSIASGIVRTGGGRNGYSGFVTKACHTNENSCRRWVQRIGFEIPNLDTVETAYCKRVR